MNYPLELQLEHMPVLKCFASLIPGRNMEEEKDICFSSVKKQNKTKQNFEILQPGILTTARRFQSSFTGNGAGDDESQQHCVAAFAFQDAWPQMDWGCSEPCSDWRWVRRWLCL